MGAGRAGNGEAGQRTQVSGSWGQEDGKDSSPGVSVSWGLTELPPHGNTWFLTLNLYLQTQLFVCKD